MATTTSTEYVPANLQACMALFHRLAWAAGVFVITLAIYLPTVFPTASGGDATELATAACQLGVAHPPGYPLFTMLGHLAYRLLPYGDCAYRVNVMSTVVSSLTASVIFLCVYQWTSMEAASILAAGLFSFAPLVWTYAVQAEVFALNNLFAAALFWQLARFEQQLSAVTATSPSSLSAAAAAAASPPAAGAAGSSRPAKGPGQGGPVALATKKTPGPHAGAVPTEKSKGGGKQQVADASPDADTQASARAASREVFWTTCQGALLCGLALCNQHTMVLYVAPVAAWVTYASFRSGVLRVGRCLAYIACFAVGLAPYGYLAWASTRSMPGSWGDCSTWEGFLTHVLRREYGTLTLFSGSPATRSVEHALDGLNLFARAYISACRYVGVYPTLLAMALIVFPKPTTLGGLQPPVQRAGAVLLACLGLYTVLFHYLANLPLDNPLFMGVQARFWLQSYVPMFLLLGVGAAIILPHVTMVIDRLTLKRLPALNAAVTGAIRTVQWQARVNGLDSPVSRKEKKVKKDKVGGAVEPSAHGSFTGPSMPPTAKAGENLGTDNSADNGAASDVAGGKGGQMSDLARLHRWHADTLLRGSLAIAMALVLAHAGVSYRVVDESNNYLVVRYGQAHLDVLPQNARLIVKGDIITNTLRYLQQHHKYRTDVQVVDQSLLTYPWFIPIHGTSLPGFSFPGKFYHPYKPGGFSMRELLVANIGPGKGPLYLAGGWNEEDNSQQGWFEEIPLGMVELVIPARSAQDKQSPDYARQHWRWLNESAGLLPNFTLQGMYGPERWETVVVKDYWGAYHRRAYYHLMCVSLLGGLNLSPRWLSVQLLHATREIVRAWQVARARRSRLAHGLPCNTTPGFSSNRPP
eukprot:jgi/Mesvir1/27021/Mv20727-RA.1